MVADKIVIIFVSRITRKKAVCQKRWRNVDLQATWQDTPCSNSPWCIDFGLNSGILKLSTSLVSFQWPLSVLQVQRRPVEELGSPQSVDQPALPQGQQGTSGGGPSLDHLQPGFGGQLFGVGTCKRFKVECDFLFADYRLFPETPTVRVVLQDGSRQCQEPAGTSSWVAKSGRNGCGDGQFSPVRTALAGPRVAHWGLCWHFTKLPELHFQKSFSSLFE